jgi:AbrB family looped-hinge helix DNA binding protein
MLPNDGGNNTESLSITHPELLLMDQAVVTVTKKGQATIPKKMRERHGIGRKALVEDTEEGVLLKPLPSPSMERGSLRSVFKGRLSKEIMEEVRRAESTREKALTKGRRD